MERTQERLVREERILHQVTLVIATFILPVFWLIYRVLEPAELDPMPPRVAIGTVSGVMAVATMVSPRMRRLLPAFSYAITVAILLLMLWLAQVNEYSVTRVLGVAIVHFCASYVFMGPRQSLLIHSVVLGGSIYGALSLDGDGSKAAWMLAATLVVIALFHMMSVVRRTRSISALIDREHALHDARASLEERVLARTEELEREVEERRAAEQRAYAASQAKSQFLANMSHELRTPLNAVIGYAELSREELAMGEANVEDLDRVIDSAHHLLRMINDILDLAKVESGAWEFVYEEVPVGELLQQAQAQVKPLLDQNRNELVIDTAPDLPPLWTDPTRLLQVLVNLLSNAAKFTRDGTVTLRVRRNGPRDEPTLELSVTDTGCGIPPDQLERVFDKFVQLDGSSTRQHRGTGLGLAICREMVRSFGGEMVARSVMGRGSTFSVTIPWRDRPPTARELAAGTMQEPGDRSAA